MYDFFKEIALESEEKLSEKRVEDIKAAVLSRIKEEHSMKKINAFKTLSIAATVAATAAMSAMLASAENAPMSPLVRNDTAITAPAAVEPTTSAPEAAETPKNEGKNVTYTEMTGDIPTEQKDGKWVYLDCPNGTKAEYFVPDGKAPMSFDSVKAAIDYSNSRSTPSTEEEWVSSFDCCDNFAVILVDV